jgi:hypothetical protein
VADSALCIAFGVVLLVLAIVADVVGSEVRRRADRRADELRQRADRRAGELVRKFLMPAELEQLRCRAYLDVPSRATAGRIYRIPAQPGIVTVIEYGKPIMRLCLLPTRALPAAEHVLVHKLLLEGAEADYWQRANCFAWGLGGGSPGIPAPITPSKP